MRRMIRMGKATLGYMPEAISFDLEVNRKFSSERPLDWPLPERLTRQVRLISYTTAALLW